VVATRAGRLAERLPSNSQVPNQPDRSFEAADKLRVLRPHTLHNSHTILSTQVFLSHLHSDHVATLYVAAKYGRTTPLEVWGPTGEAPDMGTAAAVAGLRQVRLRGQRG
jgi:phosphoribosyl 1,2-cyclic phosphodiesterase